MHTSDLIICFAYFSIPLQILVSLWQYPRLAAMPVPIFVLLVLVAFFIFLCGAGHLLRCLSMAETNLFHAVNISTAAISLMTALYLLPLVPSVFGQLDSTIAELKQMNKEAIESKRKLFTFMAFLCHEIRNPLFAITSSATCCLEDTDLTGEQAIAVGSIMDSAILMLRLVNDVLDLSKIDAGKLQLEERTFDLHRMFDNLVHNFGRQILQKSNEAGNLLVKFAVTMGDDVPHLVSADPVRMLQIVYNLLSNALKFTQEGRIDLKVTMCSHADAVRAGLVEPTCRERVGMESSYNAIPTDDMSSDGAAPDHDEESNIFSMALLDSVEAGHVGSGHSDTGVPHAGPELIYLKICVTDTGVGIAPDRLENIFEPYSQAKLSDYRKHGGTGLGLSIISGLSKAMEGKISATSEINVGSSFAVRMPIKVSTMTTEQAVEQGITEAIRTVGRNHSDVLTNHPPLKLSSMRLPNFPSAPAPAHVKRFDTSDTDDSSSDSQLLRKPTGKISDALFWTNGAKGLDAHSSVTFDVALMNGSTSGRSGTTDKETGSRPKKSLTPASKKKKLKPLVLAPSEHVVLIVDDNQVNQKIIAKMLAHFQVEYRIAGDGQEAVDLFLEGSRNIHPLRTDLPHFSLVFMDLCMPILDGYDAITELRKHGVAIPIVALTANALQQGRDRAMSVGATDFQTKPILRKDLHQVCMHYLQAQQLPLQEQAQTKHILAEA